MKQSKEITQGTDAEGTDAEGTGSIVADSTTASAATTVTVKSKRSPELPK